jgi:tetratricopeptide (TPR) repeat protein
MSIAMQNDMKIVAKVLIGIISLTIGFFLIKNVHSFSDLLFLLFGILFLLLIPAYSIGPVIARLLSHPLSLFYFPTGIDGNKNSLRAAYHKVAKTKSVNRPDEALKDYKIIVDKWSDDTEAYIAILKILFELERYTDADSYYEVAKCSVPVQDIKFIEKTRNDLINSVFSKKIDS